MNENIVRCRHVWVIGRVQGVWFRARTCDKARELGLDGWVRNLPDGRVEVWAQGAEEPLAQLLEWLRSGPPLARVDQLLVEEESVQTVREGFEII